MNVTTITVEASGIADGARAAGSSVRVLRVLWIGETARYRWSDVEAWMRRREHEDK